VLAEEFACGICGRWVDKSLAYQHPLSAQVDHVIPVSVAPELTMVRSNLRLTHRRCNRQRGTGLRRPPQPAKPTPRSVFGPLSTSRQW
jgi:5-methylcytosine-specific restriction endonuclease McrA